MTGAVAATEPWWTPGTAHGYHVHTFGFLAGELVRRVTGEPVGAMLARDVAGPMAADVWFGLPAAERSRLSAYTFGDIGGGGEPAPVSPAPPHDPSVPEGLRELRHCAYMYPAGASGIGTVNTPAWLDAELPSANAHATARAVARIFAALLDGRLLDAATLGEATAPASEGEDVVLGRPSRFGLGFQLTQPERPLGPNPRAFGHFGAGGAVGFADPDAGVAFGYVMNRGGPRWRNPRNQALIAAVERQGGLLGAGILRDDVAAAAEDAVFEFHVFEAGGVSQRAET
mgnify:CR=1 FL=1